MNKFKIVQKNVLSAISESSLTEFEKQDIFNYLFWNLAWDFDCNDYSKSTVDIPEFMYERKEINKNEIL